MPQLDLNEDELALLWGACQVWFAAGALTEPDAGEQEKLDRLQILSDRVLLTQQEAYGAFSERRSTDHAFRSTIGIPTRCAQQAGLQGTRTVVIDTVCNRTADDHTSGGGLADTRRGIAVGRRAEATRSSQGQGQQARHIASRRPKVKASP